MLPDRASTDHPDRELLAAIAKLMRVVAPADPEVGLLLHDMARALERVIAGDAPWRAAQALAAGRPPLHPPDDPAPA